MLWQPLANKDSAIKSITIIILYFLSGLDLETYLIYHFPHVLKVLSQPLISFGIATFITVPPLLPSYSLCKGAPETIQQDIEGCNVPAELVYTEMENQVGGIVYRKIFETYELEVFNS